MARALRWGELKSGLIGLAVIVFALLSIVLFARVGAVRGDTSTLYVIVEDAMGVLGGTEIWLSGEKVGLVKKIHFLPPSPDTARRLAIEGEVLTSKLNLIRKNSYTDIRPGGNLIGSPVVYIEVGTLAARPVSPGDTLFSVPGESVAGVSDQVARLTTRLTALVDSSKKVLSMLNSPAGAVGAFSSSGIPELTNVNATISRMTEQAMRGDGTIGLAMRADLGARLGRISAAKDSITMLLSSPRGSLGRFKRDSTLMPAMARIKSQLDSLRLLFGNSAGTMGRAKSDTTLAAEMARMSRELEALMTDIMKHRLRYISF